MLLLRLRLKDALIWKIKYSSGRERGTTKKPESPTGIEPITIQQAIDTADPSSRQDACHIWTK